MQLKAMTSEEAATIQVAVAIAQVILALVIGVATDLHPWIAEIDEPLNYVLIENHSPLDLNELTLSAEIFGHKAECPTDQYPAIHHFGLLPDLGPHSKQLWCIDEAMDKAIDVMKIGPNESSPFKGIFTAFVRLHLHFRRKSDGTAFNRKLLLGVFKKPDLRPMAVYSDYRMQLHQ